MDAMLDDTLTGPAGAFPTNLTGGLKGRGHPLGATGMIQIVENHRLIREKGFGAGLSHSIGGPINNNVVTLLERSDLYHSRRHEPYKPWGLPSLGRLKPKNANLDALLAATPSVKGSFVTSTTRFDYKTGRPEVVILIIACRLDGIKYHFLFGIDGEHYGQVAGIERGAPVSVERQDDRVLVNRMPVRKFYTRTINGLVELAGSGWKRLTGRG
jgi:hypothetical protein